MKYSATPPVQSERSAVLRLDIRIFHPGQTVLKEGEFGEMTYILVHGEASKRCMQDA